MRNSSLLNMSLENCSLSSFYIGVGVLDKSSTICSYIVYTTNIDIPIQKLRIYSKNLREFLYIKNIFSDLKKELLLYNQKRESYNTTKKLLINDFINMEYARNMTIIENAYNKYNEERKQVQVQKKLKSKLKPLPKVKYSSSINLNSFLKPEDLKEPNSAALGPPDGSLASAASGRSQFVRNADTVNKVGEANNDLGSCWVINTDKIDEKNSPGLKMPTRSESVAFNLKGILEEEPFSKFENK